MALAEGESGWLQHELERLQKQPSRLATLCDRLQEANNGLQARVAGPWPT